MSVIVYVRPPWLYFTCPPELGSKAHLISPLCKYDKKVRAFKAPFGVKQLVLLKQTYPQAIIQEGQAHIDSLKKKLANTQSGKNAFANMSGESVDEYLCSYQFKLTPRAHQRKALFYLSLFQGGALFADCGTGKTAATLWDIEIKYSRNEIRPSSVLIVGKLMTLFSGWHEDCEKFTNLSSKVLWEPSKAKRIKNGESELIADHGPKPTLSWWQYLLPFGSAVPLCFRRKSKEYSKTIYYHKGTRNEVILANAKRFNPDRHDKYIKNWKQIGNLKYGRETITPISTLNVRTESITRVLHHSRDGIHVINHEGLLHFEDALRERRYDMIVIDESTAIKNPKSKIFQALMRICEHTTFRRILSGTPSPQGPQDLWAQLYFLDGGLTLGSNYEEFLDSHFDMMTFGSMERGTYKGKRPVIRKHGNKGLVGTVEHVQAQLANRVFRCKLRDCIDLPPIQIIKRDIYLSAEQWSYYEDMEEKLLVELQGSKVEVTTDLAKIMKLRQISSGFIIDALGTVLKTSEKNPKLDALDSLIQEIDPEEKIVIFAVYRNEIKMLLEKYGSEAVAIYGDVKDTDKFQAQQKFIKDPKVKYIICQPSSAAYGVNGLTVARYLIFYSIDYRADTNYQAIKRIERAGQTRNMFVYYLLAKETIDEVIYEAVYKKDEIQQKTIDVEIRNRFTRNRSELLRRGN